MRKAVVPMIVLVVALLCSTPNAQAGPYFEAYTEAWGSGWGSWLWRCSLLETTARAFKGSRSMRVTYDSLGWGGFGLGSGQNFSTDGYPHLVFAFYSEQSNNNLWAYMRRASDGQTNYLQIANYTETLQIAGGKWIWVRIPVVDFGLGNAPIISDFGFQSGTPNSVVYYDEINFAASVTVYEGVQAEKGPGTQLYPWNATWSQPSSADNYWLNVTPTAPWGSVHLVMRAGGAVSSSHGALTFWFRKTSAAQNLHVSISNQNGNVVGTVAITNEYLPAGVTLQPNFWYQILIPLSDFFLGTVSLGGVAFESSTANNFLIDNVRFVQKFGWPIIGVERNAKGGFQFGEPWLNACAGDGLMKLHNGVDYTDADNQNRPIYAVSRGFVKQKEFQTNWGWAVVIQHESGLTTNYLHLNQPNLAVNQEIQRGALIGSTAYIVDENGNPISHLHFGMRLANFDSLVSQTGALPQTPCVINGNPYPAFPSSFVDPENMDWGTLQ
jgi:murein DD-endopeptidase MepM/ murein hydrolase activator NlpD